MMSANDQDCDSTKWLVQQDIWRWSQWAYCRESRTKSHSHLIWRQILPKPKPIHLYEYKLASPINHLRGQIPSTTRRADISLMFNKLWLKADVLGKLGMGTERWWVWEGNHSGKPQKIKESLPIFATNYQRQSMKCNYTSKYKGIIEHSTNSGFYWFKSKVIFSVF